MNKTHLCLCASRLYADCRQIMQEQTGQDGSSKSKKLIMQQCLNKEQMHKGKYNGSLRKTNIRAVCVWAVLHKCNLGNYEWGRVFQKTDLKKWVFKTADFV